MPVSLTPLLWHNGGTRLLPMIEFKLNGREVQGEPGQTILQVAEQYGVEIPTLCYHPALEPAGMCRLCTVEVFDGGKTRFVTACNCAFEKRIMTVSCAVSARVCAKEWGTAPLALPVEVWILRWIPPFISRPMPVWPAEHVPSCAPPGISSLRRSLSILSGRYRLNLTGASRAESRSMCPIRKRYRIHRPLIGISVCTSGPAGVRYAPSSVVLVPSIYLNKMKRWNSTLVR